MCSRRQHEELEVEENVEEEAKKLKHEADHEVNIRVKCTKYLQVGSIRKIPYQLIW